MIMFESETNYWKFNRDIFVQYLSSQKSSSPFLYENATKACKTPMYCVYLYMKAHKVETNRKIQYTYE